MNKNGTNTTNGVGPLPDVSIVTAGRFVSGAMNAFP